MQGRTYKYMTETPLYPFGYGLSYSRFEYGDIGLSSSELQRGEDLELAVTVRNVGDVDAEEVVQLYHSASDAEIDVPISTLIDFRRVQLSAGESKVLKFEVTPEQMQVFDAEGQRQFTDGTHTLHVGGVSPGARGAELTGSAPETVSIELR